MHVGRNLFSVIVLCLLFLSLGYNGFYPSFALFSISKRNYFYSQSNKIPMDKKLMDLDDFEFVQNHEDICESIKMRSQDTLILTLVHSARGNFESRQAIRNTWGSVKEHGNWKFRTIFLLGIPTRTNSPPFLTSTANEDESIEKNLKAEIETNGDITIGNFVDTYRNMTYKHLMGYKWVRHFCPWAEAVLRTDDDMFVDIFQLTDFLEKNRNDTNSMFCLLMKNRPPERGSFDKWGVSRAEYKYDVYPDYCLGAAYVTRPNLMDKLYRASEDFKYFWIDDVFVTGMLRTHPNLAGSAIRVKDISKRFSFYDHKTEKGWVKEWMFVLVPRKLVPPVLGRLWNRTVRAGNYSSAFAFDIS